MLSPVEMVAANEKPSSIVITSPPAKDSTEAAIRFYTSRVKRDPEDTRSQNALAECYLQRVRNSGNEDYLPLALSAAQASLDAVPPVRNFGGLLALAHTEFANHAFAAARDHALELTQLAPDKSEPYAVLGDAYLELGEYDCAAEAFRKMEHLDEKNPGTETRLARLAFLRGSTDAAQKHFVAALELLRLQPQQEITAWCEWQLGETAFAIGDFRRAEKHYRDALKIIPNHFRAIGSLGRLAAERDDLSSAINYYEQAVRVAPGVEYMAALGDLYQRSGRARDARIRYELVEQLGAHSRKVHGTPFDRRMALFYADHDVRSEEAYAMARGEYEAGRHDIYGADAIAWTAFKSGRLAEAKSAMKDALRLGTRDMRLAYHAEMIARKMEQPKSHLVYHWPAGKIAEATCAPFQFVDLGSNDDL